ncbi:hypothetical protein EDC01DRAFT_636142 [Geopyxis carbonaria]|nr:hypothetical protein EDC01DRAFT_636142 [Geopyxis carbonaria]
MTDNQLPSSYLSTVDLNDIQENTTALFLTAIPEGQLFLYDRLDRILTERASVREQLFQARAAQLSQAQPTTQRDSVTMQQHTTSQTYKQRIPKDSKGNDEIELPMPDDEVSSSENDSENEKNSIKRQASSESTRNSTKSKKPVTENPPINHGDAAKFDEVIDVERNANEPRNSKRKRTASPGSVSKEDSSDDSDDSILGGIKDPEERQARMKAYLENAYLQHLEKSLDKSTVNKKNKNFCQYCTRCFPSMSILEDHVWYDHGGLDKTAVRYLGTYVKNLLTSEKKDHGKTAQKIEKCDFKTSNQPGSKNAKIFQCPICPRSFALVMWLRRHVQSVHDKEKPKSVNNNERGQVIGGRGKPKCAGNK